MGEGEMGGIFLGNLTVEQIEWRLGIHLSEEHRKELADNRQEKVNNTPIEPGKWRCFDWPFMMMTHDMETASKFRDILMRYDMSQCHETFQIGWEAAS